MLSTSLNFEYKKFLFFFLFTECAFDISAEDMYDNFTYRLYKTFIYLFFKYITISGPRTNDIILCRNVEVKLEPISSYSWSPKKNVR